MNEIKAALRREMRARRSALAQEEQAYAAQEAFRNLAAFAPYRQAKTVMAYMACRGELSLAPVIEDVLLRGGTLLLPRCEAPGVMTARRVRDLSQLAPGAYGVMEPKEACEVFVPKEIDLVLVPGAAFDLRGGRLGQGGGYYDRFLVGTDALRLGVCHGFACTDRVPMDAQDVRMDGILTPQGLRLIQKNTSDNGRT